MDKTTNFSHPTTSTVQSNSFLSIMNVDKSKIMEIFTEMNYEENTVDSHGVVTQWFSDNDAALNSMFSDYDVLTYQEGRINMLSGIYGSFDWNKYCSNIDFVQRTLLMNRFADELQKSESLIIELERNIRHILPKDTAKSLLHLVQCLRYYSGTCYKYTSQEPVNPHLIDLSRNVPLAMLGYAFGNSLNCCCRMIFDAQIAISFVVLAIVDIAKRVGFPAEQFVIRTWDDRVIRVGSNAFLSISSYGFHRVLEVAFDRIPLIVFNSADLDSACECVIKATWGYGLMPWSVGTLLIQEDVSAVFIDKLKTRLSGITFGEASNSTSEFSITPKSASELLVVVKTATKKGIEVYQPDSKQEFKATLFIGGKVYENSIRDPPRGVPCLTVLTFRNLNEAAALANNTNQGFAASVWSEHQDTVNGIIHKLEVGTVWVNSHGLSKPHISLQPRKNSGFGSLGGGYYNAFPRYEYNYTGGNIKMFGVYESTFKAAKHAQLAWVKLSALERGERLRNFGAYLQENREELEKYGIPVDTWIKESLEFSTRCKIPMDITFDDGFEIRTYREPIGVVAVLDADNYQHVIEAVAYGNAVVILCDCIETKQMLSQIITCVRWDHQIFTYFVKGLKDGSIITSSSLYLNRSKFVTDKEMLIHAVTYWKTVWCHKA